MIPEWSRAINQSYYSTASYLYSDPADFYVQAFLPYFPLMRKVKHFKYFQACI